MSSMAVPKLRFKDVGGREFPKLKNGKIGDVIVELKATINPEDNPEKLYIEYSMPAFDNGKLPDTVYGKNMHSIRKVITEPCVLINKLNVRKQRIWLHNEFEEDAVCSTEFVALGSRGLCSLEYINQLALTERFTGYLLSNSSGTSNSQQRVSPAMILSFGFPIPSLPEQQKIANFLTVYDTMIDTQAKRVEAMKLRKKGLLQKIFLQEIRFKDAEGKDFPEWEEKCLEKISSVYDGVHQTPNYVETGVPFVSVENINDLENTNKFISMEDFKKDFKVYPEKDDILMTRIGDIGTSALVPKEGFAYYVSLALIKTKKNAIIPKFLNQYIKSNIFQHELYKRSLQYAFPKKINKGEIGKCVVKVPSLPEQQKIADFLTAVYKQIEVEEKRLETMKTIKKGLLQQMFV